MAIDPRFLAADGPEVFSGNELLVKGCLETGGGVHLLTGYPGSPVAGFFDTLGTLAPLVQEKGMRAFQANNEALGVAALNGSQMAPVRGIVAFKSVGLHVASDALAIGNLAGAHPDGGAVVVCGDDPWCDSTQVPADSRFLLEHLRMAVVEPGSMQEVKDWVGASFALSRAAGVYVGYVVTTAQADGGGTVECRPNHYPSLNTNQRVALDTASIDLGKVLLPPRTWQKELGMEERHRRTVAAARELRINEIVPATASMQKVSPLGFVTTGMARPYLEQVLADLGLSGVFPVCNMGMSYPADAGLLRDFAATCRDMVVIEERRSFLERNLRDALYKAFDRATADGLSARLYGKQFPGDAGDGIPETRGLNPSVLAQLLIPLVKRTRDLPADLRNGRLSAELDLIKRTGKRKLEVVGVVKGPVQRETETATRTAVCDAPADADPLALRTPTFCPGCPHRDSSATLLELRRNLADADYMKSRHDREPVELVAHGDTGCYTMLMFAPTEQLMHNYSGMGLGGGTGSGIDPFITNKQIVFMGDGTFYHSGQVAISNAIKAGQDLTFIILENGTTAMTGHQEHAGTEVDLLGNRSHIQDIHAIVRGMRGTSPLTVEKVDPSDRAKWYRTLEKTILADGVKVLIADKECGITYHRRRGKEERETAKKHGFLPRKTHMNVTPEVCENCLECTKATACPGLVKVETDYGPKIDTDLTWCVNDGACERVQVSNDAGTNVKPCPSFEQVTVIRKRRKRYTLPRMHLSKLPDPTPRRRPTAGDPWRVHLAGVGGMGVGVVGSILVKAGHREGYRVAFSEKKGLAIRNGGVYAQIAWCEVGSRKSEVGSDGERRGVGEHDASPASDFRLPTSDFATPTGQIPYGRADLVLGVDVLEAARAVDPREPFRVAVPERTAAVLNLHKQPTVYTLLGRDDFDPAKLRDRIYAHCDPAASYAKDMTDICQTRLGSSQFVNIMMLGAAYQLGLIPVSAGAIGRAIKDVIRRDRRRNVKAFNIGRKLALEPRVLPPRPEPRTWQQLLTTKLKIVRKTHLLGELAARSLDRATRDAVAAMPDLPEQLKYDLALRLYDLTCHGGGAVARRYAARVRLVYAHDSAARRFAATKAAVWGLARVTLIKDEPYVAHLLTRPEKKARDDAKYGVDRSNGDTIRYRHHTSPEFPIGRHRRLRLKLTTTDWQLQLVARQTWLRRLPGWHRRETEFRDWYAATLDRLATSPRHAGDWDHDAGYRRIVAALSCPEAVTGYREVRYPKQDAAIRQVDADLARPLPSALVRPAPTPATRAAVESDAPSEPVGVAG